MRYVSNEHNLDCCMQEIAAFLVVYISCMDFIFFYTFYLVCVDDFEVFPKQGRPPTEEELHQFFLSFRGYCARKGVLKLF